MAKVTEILDPPRETIAARRWPGAALVILTALGAAGGFLLTTVLQPTYTASARLMVMGGADPTVPIHVRIETERALVEAPQVIARVIATERLNADREFGQATATEWDRQVAAWGLSGWLGRAPIGPDVASRLEDAAEVARVGDAALFDVSVTSRDPNKAARLANAMVDAYLTERTDLANMPVSTVSKDDLARLEKAVFDAETALSDVRRHLGGAAESEPVEARMEKARQRLADAETRVRQLEAAVRAGASGIFEQDAEGGSLRELRRAHAEAMRRQADLLREYGPKHYRIIEVNRELDRLRDQGLAEARRVLDRARSEIARERETIRTLEREITSPATSHPEEAKLRQALLDARQAHEIALNRARAAQASAAPLEPVTTRILARATPPLASDQVSGTALVGSGALFGLVLGVVLSLARRAATGASHSPLTLEPTLAISEPAFEDTPEPVEAPRAFEPSPLAPLADPVIQGRDVVLSLGDAAACHRTALALARAAAAHGRVVLVDVDGQSSPTTSLLGLGDVLEGAARFPEALHADPISALHRMPPGRRAAPSFHRFPLVLDALDATYDRVIISLGELPDAPELIALFDTAERVIVATDAAISTGAEAEAIAALAAVVGLGQGTLHLVAAPTEAMGAEPHVAAWRRAG